MLFIKVYILNYFIVMQNTDYIILEHIHYASFLLIFFVVPTNLKIFFSKCYKLYDAIKLIYLTIFIIK